MIEPTNERGAPVDERDAPLEPADSPKAAKAPKRKAPLAACGSLLRSTEAARNARTRSGLWGASTAAGRREAPRPRAQGGIKCSVFISPSPSPNLATLAAGNVTGSRVRVFSLRHEFERAWAVFCAGNDTAKHHELEILLHQGLFRAFTNGPKVKVTGVRLGVTFNPRYAPDSTGLDFDLFEPGGSTDRLASNVSFMANEPSQPASGFGTPNVLRLDASPAAWKLRVRYTDNGTAGTIPTAIKTGTSSSPTPSRTSGST